MQIYNSQPRPDLYSYANEMAVKYKPTYNLPRYNIEPIATLANQGNTAFTGQQLFVGYSFISIFLASALLSEMRFFIAPGLTPTVETLKIFTESIAGRQLYNYNTGLVVFNYSIVSAGSFDMGCNGYLITYS